MCILASCCSILATSLSEVELVRRCQHDGQWNWYHTTSYPDVYTWGKAAQVSFRYLKDIGKSQDSLIITKCRYFTRE